MNIIYENENKQNTTPPHQNSRTGSSSSSISSYDWLGSSLAQINLSSLTSSALKLADEIHQSLSIQAETASAQMNQELLHAVAAANANASSSSRHEGQMKRSSSSSISTPLPWDTEDEKLSILSEEVMGKVLQLSQVDGNFIEAPSPRLEENLSFVFQEHVPIILRLLPLDVNLKNAHARLAHKMDEQVFWRNYFLRVKYLRRKAGLEEDKDGIAASMSESEAGIHWPMPPIAVPGTGEGRKETPLPMDALSAEKKPSSSPAAAYISSSSSSAPRSVSEKTSVDVTSSSSGIAITPSVGKPPSAPAASSGGVKAIPIKTNTTTVGSRLLQELDDVMDNDDTDNNSSSRNSPAPMLSKTSNTVIVNDYVLSTPPPNTAGKKENRVEVVRKEEGEDEEDDFDLNDLDLDGLELSDLEGDFDEDDLEAEIERELSLDDSN